MWPLFKGMIFVYNICWLNQKIEVAFGQANSLFFSFFIIFFFLFFLFLQRSGKRMGTCQSTESVETKGNHDQNVVYVADANRPGSDEDGRRRIASLYSQRGKKGPNQDAVILCQVCQPPVFLQIMQCWFIFVACIVASIIWNFLLDQLLIKEFSLSSSFDYQQYCFLDHIWTRMQLKKELFVSFDSCLRISMSLGFFLSFFLRNSDESILY